MGYLVIAQAPSQSAQILEVLASGRTLTPLEALKEMGCLRLAARIFELRAAGHPIEVSVRRVAGKTFAAYYLAAGQGKLPL